MAADEFYTDRTGQPTSRNRDVVTDTVWRGLAALIEARISGNWFAHEFPAQCPDGNGVAGTDFESLINSMNAMIPGLEWPVSRLRTPPTGMALDLVDFSARRIAKPSNGRLHTYFGHHELTFDANQGREEFREDVNLLFARSGLAFELGAANRVTRLGPPESRRIVADLRPNTGDDLLDDLIVEARIRYTSRSPADVRVALERLWDGFERLKTIWPGDNKRQQVSSLLDRVAGEPMRTFLDEEASALTKIGNQMNIRHFETDRSTLTEAEVDYLFVRMSGLVVHLLRATNKLDGPDK